MLCAKHKWDFNNQLHRLFVFTVKYLLAKNKHAGGVQSARSIAHADSNSQVATGRLSAGVALQSKSSDIR